MADMIQCPVCGASNPADEDICQTCQSPLGDPNAEGSIQSGEAPTKKQTAELEPILPQWLREARDAARTSEPEDSSESMPRQSEKSKPAAPVDLLAGLQSQSEQDDEEDVPDWLANITGAQPKPKAEPQPVVPEPATERRVELGSLGDFDQEEEPEESDMPAWLAGIQSSEEQPEKDELTDWLHSASDAQPTQPPEPTPAFDTSLPETPSGGDTPDWLRQMAMDADQDTAEPADQAAEGSLDLPSDTPDWLRAMSGSEEKPQTAATPEPQESAPAESEAPDFSFMDVPDWLKGPTESESPSPDTSPKWLRDDSNAVPGEETPAWLSSEDTVYLPPDPQQESSEADDLLTDLPDWLKAAAPESSIFAQPADEEPAQEESAPEPSDASQPAEAFSTTEESSPFENAPAFTPDLEGNDNVNSLFTEMPDWLSTAMEPSASETPSSSPTPITSDDILAPSDLPSWVQAMRPVEPGIIAQASLSSDQTLESRGALAGLQGVLPAVPGFAPTSKPKAYSIKLNANDEQLKHAEILEQILAAETSPVPIESFPAIGPSRILRWALAFIMVLMIGLVTGLKMQNFSMPLLAPNEMREAISVIQSLPPNSTLLVAMDYEAARAGEMEAASAAMFDQLALLKQPSLVFVSTNELGSALAERIITGPLAGHSVSYTNLGYLSGGQLGIRAFAQDPNTALGNFAAVILITDNADAARSWIEQTQDLRTMPFIVVSSAQSTPMIQPYYESRQVAGLISGLYGGSIFEQYNAGRPGTARRYWDAYSLGMLIAMSLVLGGGFWNLALGLRDRAAAREAK